MNIVFIGSRYVNSTSRGLAPIMREYGCEWSGFIDSTNFVTKFVETYVNQNLDKFLKEKKPFPLSFFWKIAPTKIKEKFDVIFVEQNAFNFTNDIEIPAIYYHRDIPTPLFMEDMDILLYRFKKMEEVISEDYPEIWEKTYRKRYLNAVSIEEFAHNLPKIYNGLNWIGWQKPLEYYWKFPDQKAYYAHVKVILDYVRKNMLINYHPHGINYGEARRILQQSEAVLIVPGNEAYVTRKIYEAAVAKTLIVLWVQNDLAEITFKELGLVHGKNCIMFRKKEDLKDIVWDIADVSFDKEGMLSKAFKWVSENHTWHNRAKELMEICKENGIA